MDYEAEARKVWAQAMDAYDKSIDEAPMSRADVPAEAVIESALRRAAEERDRAWLCALIETAQPGESPMIVAERAMKRAAEEAEVRAFGDRRELVAEVERLRLLVTHDAAHPNCGECRDCFAADRYLLKLAVDNQREDRAALVAAGDALVEWLVCGGIEARPARDEWDRLAHPERA